MEKIALKCDVCGGTLTMQPGGQGAVCEYCGMNYAIGRLREKVQEIRGTVKVEGVVKTQRADFDIQSGVLIKYHGRSVDVVVPDDVLVIGKGAFGGLKMLRSVVLPEGLKIIEGGGRADDDDEGAFYIEDGGAFDSCSGLTQITLPESLTTIGNSTFHGCSGLTQISLPEGLTIIGDCAFRGCEGLKQITLPKSLKEIGRFAFSGCSGLTQISLPEGLTTIGWRAFNHCSGLTEITLPTSLEEWSGAFRGSGLKKITVPGKKAYKHLSGLVNHTCLEAIYPTEAADYFTSELLKRPGAYAGAPPLMGKVYRQYGKCQYCGHKFEGLIIKKCEYCHKPKDY